jgi:hypothetical protein
MWRRGSWHTRWVGVTKKWIIQEDCVQQLHHSLAGFPNTQAQDVTVICPK